MAEPTEWVFYDGGCGLCHRAVLFALAHDRRGVFRYAPLDGETFLALVPAPDRTNLPDTMVVRRSDGSLLTRSAAVLHIANRCGGVWRALARVARAVPAAARDVVYDMIARWRHRFFARPADECPVVPVDLRGRFAP